MCSRCRVLIVEDLEDDALLVVRAIQREGYDVVWKRVQTCRDLEAALGEQQWDLVIADYVQPEYCGLSAFLLVRSKDLNLPFVLVSGSADPAIVAIAKRLGVDEFVAKSNLGQLGAAIRHHLPKDGPPSCQ